MPMNIEDEQTEKKEHAAWNKLKSIVPDIEKIKEKQEKANIPFVMPDIICKIVGGGLVEAVPLDESVLANEEEFWIKENKRYEEKVKIAQKIFSWAEKYSQTKRFKNYSRCRIANDTERYARMVELGDIDESMGYNRWLFKISSGNLEIAFKGYWGHKHWTVKRGARCVLYLEPDGCLSYRSLAMHFEEKVPFDNKFDDPGKFARVMTEQYLLDVLKMITYGTPKKNLQEYTSEFLFNTKYRKRGD